MKRHINFEVCMALAGCCLPPALAVQLRDYVISERDRDGCVCVEGIDAWIESEELDLPDGFMKLVWRASRVTDSELRSELNRVRRASQEANSKLQKRLEKVNRTMGEKATEIRDLKERLSFSESQLDPVRESLNAMTAERGKWIRKLKRAGVSV